MTSVIENVTDKKMEMSNVKKLVRREVQEEWERRWRNERMHNDQGRHLYDLLPEPINSVVLINGPSLVAGAPFDVDSDMDTVILTTISTP